jgi:hypothetical protein
METYDAFLSYSHADEKQAKRIHRFLELYRLKALKRRVRIYFDRTDMRGGLLPAELRAALQKSECLIVCASPAADKSRWIPQEISAFREAHGDERIAVILLAGQTGASHPSLNGLDCRIHDLRQGWWFGLLRPSARLELQRLLAFITDVSLRRIRNSYRWRTVVHSMLILATFALGLQAASLLSTAATSPQPPDAPFDDLKKSGLPVETKSITLPDDDDRRLPTLWVNSLASLTPQTGEHLTTAGGGLLEAVATVTLSRCDSQVVGEEIRLTGEDRHWQAPHGTITKSKRNYHIDLTLLAHHLAQEQAGSSGDASYLFRVDGGYGNTRASMQFTEFFQIIVDSTRPSLQLEGVSLRQDATESLYELDQRDPIRLYVPDDDDIDIILALKADDPHLMPRSLAVRASALNHPPRDLDATNPSRVLLSSGFEDGVVPRSRQGTLVTLNISARDKANNLTSLQRRLILDSGPDLELAAEQPLKKKDRGIVELSFQSSADSPIADALDIFWSVGDSLSCDALQAIPKTDIAVEDARIALNLRLPDDFLAGEATRDLNIFARERESLENDNTPRMTYPRGITRDALCPVQRGRVAVTPDPIPTPEDFSVQMEFPEGTATEQPLMHRLDNTFRWHAKDKARFPLALTLVPRATAFQISDRIDWKRDVPAPGANHVGPRFALPPMAGDREQSISLLLTVETLWGKKPIAPFPIHLAFIPHAPALSELRCMREDKVIGTLQHGDLALSTALEIVDANNVSFVALVRRQDHVTGATLSLPGQQPLPGVHKEDTFEFPEIQPAPIEGFHDIRLTLKDLFQNETIVAIPLIVLDRPPTFRPPEGAPAEDARVFAIAADVPLRITVQDPSGIEKIEVVRMGEGEDAGVRSGSSELSTSWKPIHEIDVSLHVDERDGFVLGRPRMVTVSIENISIKKERIAVKAWDREHREPGKFQMLARSHAREPLGVVNWLGLTWVYVRTRAGGFYMSRTEVPRWLYQNGVPQADGPDDQWLPQTELSNNGLAACRKRIRAFLDRLPGPVYLPTLDEWRAAAHPDNFRNQPPELLHAIATVIVSDHEPRVRVDHDNDPGVSSKQFSSILHLLGNVEEAVEESTSGLLRAVGGSNATSLEDCFTRTAHIEAVSSRNLGFRLVVFHEDVSETDRPGGAKANQEFLKAMKAQRGTSP